MIQVSDQAEVATKPVQMPASLTTMPRKAYSAALSNAQAISQSGTTTDTNRTVDMVKERGAHTIAIVNRRDSDITFKVDGVMYTSSGRDVEMSVASTRAFYSQIVAGAILSLYIASLKKRRTPAFVSEEIKQLRFVLVTKHRIGFFYKRVGISKTFIQRYKRLIKYTSAP